jgi:hypothetical protein
MSVGLTIIERLPRDRVRVWVSTYTGRWVTVRGRQRGLTGMVCTFSTTRPANSINVESLPVSALKHEWRVTWEQLDQLTADVILGTRPPPRDAKRTHSHRPHESVSPFFHRVHTGGA